MQRSHIVPRIVLRVSRQLSFPFAFKLIIDVLTLYRYDIAFIWDLCRMFNFVQVQGRRKF